MAESGDDRLVSLIMDGADEHQGHVMARALVEKLDKFLKTFASFERAYLGAPRRQTDFEVTRVTHNSPTEFGLNPVSKVKGYYPATAVGWTMDQWSKIAKGEKPDSIVNEDMIADVADMAAPEERFGYSNFAIKYRKQAIKFDDAAFSNAKALQVGLRGEQRSLPWRQGASQGSLTGELKSILDADSEHQIVVCPFYGPEQVRCSFTDDMKETVRQYLWGIVKVRGIVHYGVANPHPVSIDIETIEPVGLADKAPHFLDAAGIFKESVYTSWASSEIDA